MSIFDLFALGVRILVSILAIGLIFGIISWISNINVGPRPSSVKPDIKSFLKQSDKTIRRTKVVLSLSLLVNLVVTAKVYGFFPNAFSLDQSAWIDNQKLWLMSAIFFWIYMRLVTGGMGVRALNYRVKPEKVWNLRIALLVIASSVIQYFIFDWYYAMRFVLGAFVAGYFGIVFIKYLANMQMKLDPDILYTDLYVVGDMSKEIKVSKTPYDISKSEVDFVYWLAIVAAVINIDIFQMCLIMTLYNFLYWLFSLSAEEAFQQVTPITYNAAANAYSDDQLQNHIQETQKRWRSQ